MSEKAEIIELAEAYIATYRSILLLDPLLSFSVKLTDDGPACETKQDTQRKMSWDCYLCQGKNLTEEDIRLSVIEFLSEMLLSDFMYFDDPVIKEMKARASCRIFNSLQNVLPEIESEYEED